MTFEYEFTHEDRLVQVAEFGNLCAQLAALIASHDPWLADKARGLADEAARLLADGFDSGDLRALGGVLFARPDWLDPRAADYNMPREHWMHEFSDVYWAAASLASDLRARAVLRD